MKNVIQKHLDINNHIKFIEDSKLNWSKIF